VSELSIVRVALVEDRREIREGLASILRMSTGFALAGAWSSYEQGFAALPGAGAALLLADLEIPGGMSGLDAIPRLRERYPDLLVIVLSVYDDDERIFEALRAGAAGYLLKSTPVDRLLAGLRDAAEGGAPMSPGIARRVLAALRDGPRPAADHDLTAQELAVLRLLVEGHSYKSAAAELGISVNTLAFHVKGIYGKLEVHSKSAAVTRALRDRIV
jgi:DNA-binding NarL/FixJ family response regulator